MTESFLHLLGITPTPFLVARLRLSFWYMLSISLLIGGFTILVISAKTSSFIQVNTVLQETNESLTRIQDFQETFAAFNDRFKKRLLVFDFVLLILGAITSYWLSGKTLQPIKKMVDDQTAFAADISHELRTPLATLKTEVALAKRSDTGVSFDALFSSIDEEVGKMSDLITGMLELVRIQPSRINSGFRMVDFTVALREVYQQLKPQADNKQQNAQLKVLPESSMVFGNMTMLKQIIVILFDNAIKYTQESGTISLILEKNRSQLLLRVLDDGPGIDDEDQKKIFERFYRGSKQLADGSGLGLHIAKELVETHHGTIGVKSRSEGGSEFVVRLPLGRRHFKQ